MKRSIWKVGFLVLVFSSLLLGCEKNQQQSVQKLNINGLPDFQAVYKINGHEVSAYEFIKDLSDAELTFVSQEQLLYFAKVLTEDEIKSLDQAKKDAIANPELFKSLRSGQARSEMRFFDDDGKEISALDFVLVDFAKGGNAIINMTNKQKLKLLNQLSDADIEKLSFEQIEILRKND